MKWKESDSSSSHVEIGNVFNDFCLVKREKETADVKKKRHPP